MYSDRLGSSAATNRKRSIKDRLGVQNGEESSRPTFNKRFQGFEGKWQHDMYDDTNPRVEQTSSQDLRAKLKNNVSRSVQGGSTASAGIRDLRDKLSGATPPPQVHPQTVQTVSAPQPRASSAVKAPTSTVTTAPASKASATPAKPLTAPKVASGSETMTVASFLQSLGLSKYLITFQAEEIDMSVLRVMKDDELKELGIPMGPRKKISLALASQAKR